MYANLKGELTKKSITNRELANFLGKHENTIGYKLDGEGSFSIEEAFRIKEHFFPNYELKFLFEKTA